MKMAATYDSNSLEKQHFEDYQNSLKLEEMYDQMNDKKFSRQNLNLVQTFTSKQQLNKRQPPHESELTAAVDDFLELKQLSQSIKFQEPPLERPQLKYVLKQNNAWPVMSPKPIIQIKPKVEDNVKIIIRPIKSNYTPVQKTIKTKHKSTKQTNQQSHQSTFFTQLSHDEIVTTMDKNLKIQPSFTAPQESVQVRNYLVVTKYKPKIVTDFTFKRQ